MLARFAVGKYGHLHPVAQAAADVSGHGAFVGLHVAPYQRVVDPVDRMVEKLLGQPGVRPLVLRDDQNARRVLVDAVDEPGSHVPALKQRQILEVVRERVDERSRVVAVPRMYDHAGRLVDDDQVVVLVADVERNVLGDDFQFAQRVRHYDRDAVERLDLVTRLDGSAADQDVPRVGCGLNTVARDALHPVGQEFVDPQHALTFVDGHAEVLVHFVLRVGLADLFRHRKVVQFLLAHGKIIRRC